MKPFDLGRALEGDPVVTRLGFFAKKIAYVEDRYVERPLVFRPEYPGAPLLTYPRSGEYDEFKASDYDLFMATREVTLWVNILRGTHGILSSRGYSSESVALDEKDLDDYIGTYPIRVEI